MKEETVENHYAQQYPRNSPLPLGVMHNFLRFFFTINCEALFAGVEKFAWGGFLLEENYTAQSAPTTLICYIHGAAKLWAIIPWLFGGKKFSPAIPREKPEFRGDYCSVMFFSWIWDLRWSEVLGDCGTFCHSVSRVQKVMKWPRERIWLEGKVLVQVEYL